MSERPMITPEGLIEQLRTHANYKSEWEAIHADLLQAGNNSGGFRYSLEDGAKRTGIPEARFEELIESLCETRVVLETYYEGDFEGVSYARPWVIESGLIINGVVVEAFITPGSATLVAHGENYSDTPEVEGGAS